MKTLLGILIFSSITASASTTIYCDRTSWEDEGTIGLHFLGDDNSPFKNLSESCGGDYPDCKNRYFGNASYEAVGAWPLGIYSGTNKKGYGFVLTLTSYNPTSVYQRYTGYAVTLSRHGNSTDRVACYKTPFDEERPDHPPVKDEDEKVHTQE